MEKGIPVLGLVPGCHAERAGVRVGDRILNVNGHDVNDADDYANAIQRRGTSQTVVVERAGIQLELEMAIGNGGMPEGELPN